MNSKVRVVAEDVVLRIPHFVQKPAKGSAGGMRAYFNAIARPTREYVTLLDGISFTLREGDRLALLGRNGAGKTTLLRILSGAFRPTSGSLDISGSRQALLNLGLGFNPAATVHENIFLRASALGFEVASVRRLVGEILGFAELVDVADHKLATLSSGQRMRLGFAISTAFQYDIMLMDEWFGAGDASFVDRARARLNDRVHGCKILVLASHNLKIIRSTCTSGLVLDQGRAVYIGDIDRAISTYMALPREAVSDQSMARARSTLQPDLKAELRQARAVIREQKQIIRDQNKSIYAFKSKNRELRRILKGDARDRTGG